MCTSVDTLVCTVTVVVTRSALVGWPRTAAGTRLKAAAVAMARGIVVGLLPEIQGFCQKLVLCSGGLELPSCDGNKNLLRSGNVPMIAGIKIDMVLHAQRDLWRRMW